MGAKPHLSGRSQDFADSRLTFSGDPTLKEALADPVVHAMMKADRVERRHLKAMLNVIVAQLAKRP
jgi:hypothetical protein